MISEFHFLPFILTEIALHIANLALYDVILNYLKSFDFCFETLPRDWDLSAVQPHYSVE